METIRYQVFQEKLTAIHLWVSKQLISARIARDKCDNELQRVMLCGKVKAYTDVLCQLANKYKKHLL